MVSLLDHNIGLVLDALKTNGHGETTRILYTSDHGDNIGHRGLWGKSVMYEEAAKIPMILTGPDVPAGHSVAAPVSLVDCHQTILEGAGLALTEEEQQQARGNQADYSAPALFRPDPNFKQFLDDTYNFLMTKLSHTPRLRPWEKSICSFFIKKGHQLLSFFYQNRKPNKS